jgi:succinyl-diaminopimelate desuccinylase
VNIQIPEAAIRETLLALTQIQSPIGEEKEICDWVEARLQKSFGPQQVSRHSHSLIARVKTTGTGPHIALVGHLDTVRTQHDKPSRVEGNRLYGAGAADMKSGLALMLEVAERIKPDQLPCDLSLIFYEREEGPFLENGLGPLMENFPEISQVDFAICLEPSDNELQLGCVGSVHATVDFAGRTAHSARPWQGENAIYKSVSFLQALSQRKPVEHEIDGHRYCEVMNATLASGGRGKNVIPDTFTLNINYRFAPGRTPEEAVADIENLVGDAGVVHPTDLSPSCLPHGQHPLVAHLAACGVAAVKSKQAWTDVARFDQIGVPAVNFGPGLSKQAHQPNEYTDLDLVYEGYGILARFLSGIS